LDYLWLSYHSDGAGIRAEIRNAISRYLRVYY